LGGSGATGHFASRAVGQGDLNVVHALFSARGRFCAIAKMLRLEAVPTLYFQWFKSDSNNGMLRLGFGRLGPGAGGFSRCADDSLSLSSALFLAFVFIHHLSSDAPIQSLDRNSDRDCRLP
jgi:hypothetical protein